MFTNDCVRIEDEIYNYNRIQKKWEKYILRDKIGRLPVGIPSVYPNNKDKITFKNTSKFYSKSKKILFNITKKDYIIEKMNILYISDSDFNLKKNIIKNYFNEIFDKVNLNKFIQLLDKIIFGKLKKNIIIIVDNYLLINMLNIIFSDNIEILTLLLIKSEGCMDYKIKRYKEKDSFISIGEFEDLYQYNFYLKSTRNCPLILYCKDNELFNKIIESTNNFISIKKYVDIPFNDLHFRSIIYAKFVRLRK
jgi:hypothetical protein